MLEGYCVAIYITIPRLGVDCLRWKYIARWINIAIARPAVGCSRLISRAIFAVALGGRGGEYRRQFRARFRARIVKRKLNAPGVVAAYWDSLNTESDDDENDEKLWGGMSVGPPRA
jgi:hypothetical protein